MFAADGSPHPALDKYARLRQVQIQLSDRLGLNPKSRAEMQSARDAPIDLKILEAASERMERVHVQRYGHKNGPNGSSN
jgi:phage terminase small subunit